MEMRRFEGKTAVITGAAQGMGEAIARRFAREGGRALIIDIEVDKLEAVARSIGDAVVPMEVDVRKSDSVAAMAARAKKLFGKVDVLFNNAGILDYAPFLETTEEVFDDIMNTNTKGVFLCGKAIAQLMVDTGTQGCIVNTSSINSVITAATTSAYSASKGAVRQLTKAMAVDLGPYGIRVNAFAPGSVKTRMTEKTRANKEKTAYFHSMWSIKRSAEPEEQAAVALFLASDDASYMTGATVCVDGGWHIV